MKRLIDLLREPTVGSALESILIMALVSAAIATSAVAVTVWLEGSFAHSADMLVHPAR
jgi:Flp pilus assembly pilin Flp